MVMQTFNSSTWEAGLDRGIVSSRLVGTPSTHTYAHARTHKHIHTYTHIVCGGQGETDYSMSVEENIPIEFSGDQLACCFFFSKDLSTALIF